MMAKGDEDDGQRDDESGYCHLGDLSVGCHWVSAASQDPDSACPPGQTISCRTIDNSSALADLATCQLAIASLVVVYHPPGGDYIHYFILGI